MTLADNFTDELIADLKVRARDAFSEVGAIISDDLRKTISVPVGFALGNKGGARVIRSRPGEPPRLETGRYEATIDQITELSGNRVATTIFTDDLIGGFLERGTNRMAERPHFKPIFEEYAPGILNMIGDRVFKR